MTTKATASLLYGSVISAGLAFLPLSVALAVEAEGTLAVSAEVIVVCSVGDESLTFDPYDATSGSEGESTLLVHCTTETPGVTVSLGLGTWSDSGQRRMANGIHRLDYDLYDDADRTSPFTAVSFTGTPVDGGTQVPVYGSIPTGQSVPAGEYIDSVAILVSY